MNRRYFIALSILASLSLFGCTAFRIGWRTGGLCSDDASDVDFDYVEDSVELLGVLRIGRVRAETSYIDARKRGFEPRPGAIISNAIDESWQFIRFIRSGGFKVTGVNEDIDLYKKELCRRSCLPPIDECTWSAENEEKLKALINYAGTN